MDKYSLLGKGLFPETLPPCFTSEDLKRSLRGKISYINERALHKRSADYIRFNGTKHDGNRRYFGSPNPICYYYVSRFIQDNWKTIEKRLGSSPFSVSKPKISNPNDDRSIIIPSLSDLTTEASKKLGYSPFILKTDISQFFPSIYTHSIPWVFHGTENSKTDTSHKSKKTYFNRLDFFVRNCQSTETRGVLVGPDAFRLVAEFIMSSLDRVLKEEAGKYIVGVARHVDDYYIGINNESEAVAVLSILRDILQRYGLQINDSKTKILHGTENLNEVWAQELRRESKNISFFSLDRDKTILLINKSVEISRQIRSDSPIKIILRSLDNNLTYNSVIWPYIEPYLQRIMFHHNHCIDYICLLIVKRFAIDEGIDKSGWENVALLLIKKHLVYNHHHEVLWLVWLLVCCEIPISDQLCHELQKSDNSHIQALIIKLYEKNLVRKPKIKLGDKLSTNNKYWLSNIVAKTSGYTKAPFSGDFSEEFKHLFDRNVDLINFESHINSVREANVLAISRTRYGYDSDDDDDNFEAHL